MLLHLQTWPEVEAYLQHSRGVVIPLGSTEQHGPTGLIGTEHPWFADLVFWLKGQGFGKSSFHDASIGIGMIWTVSQNV